MYSLFQLSESLFCTSHLMRSYLYVFNGLPALHLILAILLYNLIIIYFNIVI
jgi:hypothetical protein